MAISRKRKIAYMVGAVALIGGGGVFVYEGPAKWLMSSDRAATILVSGNIEAHQSVLGFKTVQSRIVELPFDEGQWVDAGTLIARLDDSDYRQQVAIATAALEVQKRQLAAASKISPRPTRPSKATPPILSWQRSNSRAPTSC